jgi:ATPase subunit of ABC transporter with duplicated ATPase domains
MNEPARLSSGHYWFSSAAGLFSQPDLLLLDEPTNLDLEGTLWLVDYLRLYRATILVISHDRDLLDAVCDHILHLDQAKLALWRGNYSSFEQQHKTTSGGACSLSSIASAPRRQKRRKRSRA